MSTNDAPADSAAPPAPSAPFAVVALALAVAPLALLLIPLPGMGLPAAIVIGAAMVLAIIALDRATHAGTGRALAVVALTLSVVTGVASTAAGLASTLPTAFEAVSERFDRQGIDIVGAGAEPATQSPAAQISAIWVVDEFLHHCGVGHLHAAPSGDDERVFVVGQRPVSTDRFDFTVTVIAATWSWTGSARGDAPAGGQAMSGRESNPHGCADIVIDAETGDRIVDGVGAAGGPGDAAAPEGEVAFWDLEVGMCLNDENLDETVSTIPLVDCDQPHDSEVYAIVTLPSGPYPGDDEVNVLADEACLDAFEPYVGTSYQRSLYYYAYYWPDKRNYAYGNRDVICVLFDPEGPIVGTLRGSGL
ncbi:MAG: septum formation family protein [Microcella sp.]|uniref:septum formation family protein n=1 Tax=Microcella sp. TaxID=1913979 RepID=UPI0024C6402C|nr:septum formation family protein [Microcella sp.]UYN83421.1 MAG: septum formation family protein [Microcella sp.]